MDSILIFGGGLNQLLLVKSAKDLGYRTIVIDPIPDATAKKIADVFEVIAPKDYEKTKETALKYNVKGIVTCQMENPLLIMAQLAEDLNFIFPSQQSVLNARNKYLMKECFINAGVACAKGRRIRLDEELKRKYCEEIGFPLIIKPVDSFSSKGVFKVNKFEEIEGYIASVRNFSSTGDILIEEFMEGSEVSVEGVTQNKVTTIVQITDKIITPYPTAVEMLHIQPSELDAETQTEVKKLVQKAVNALGLNNCAIHAEVKITKTGPKMVELGARLGGDYITSHLVPLSTGVNIEAAAIQIAMGKKPELKHLISNSAVIEYLKIEAGKKILDIGNYSKMKDDERVKEVFVFLNKGEIVQSITDSTKRVGCVIVQEKNRNSAVNLAHIKCEELKGYLDTD